MSTVYKIFKSKANLMDPLNSPDEILIIYVKHVKHHCIFLNSNPGTHGKNVVPPAGPLFIRASKREDHGRESESLPLVDLGVASCG